MNSQTAAPSGAPPFPRMSTGTAPDAHPGTAVAPGAPPIERVLGDAPVLLAALRDTLAAAARDGVEHVHVEPDGNPSDGHLDSGWRLRRRHDDGLEEVRLAPTDALPHALRRIADHGRAFSVGLIGGPRLVALRVLPALRGDTFLLTLLDGAFAPPALDALGLEPRDLQAVRTLLRRPAGWLAVGAAGPLDGARVVRAIAQEIVSPDRAIVCLDSPPYPALARVVQLDALAITGIDLALDADAVLLASDPPPASELLAHLAARATGDFLVVRASLARRPSDILRELLSLGRPATWLAHALPALLMRHRVRLLCVACRVRAPADDVAVHRLGVRLAPRVHDVAAWLEESLVVRYRAGEGCARCDDRGHDGVRDLTTMVVPDEEVRRALRAGDVEEACARIDRGETLARRLGAMVAAGDIGAAEADRHLVTRY